MTGRGSGRASGLHVLMTADGVGGVWTYALDLARGLSARGARVTLAVLGPAPGEGAREAAGSVPGLDLVETGLPLDWLADGPEAIRDAGRALAAIARECGVDLVHLNSPAYAATASFSVPVVALCHSCVKTWWQAVRGTALDPDFLWRADMVGRGYRAADALVAPSRSFARVTAAAYGLAREPHVVTNGRASLCPPPRGEGRVAPEGRAGMGGVPSASPQAEVAGRVHPPREGDGTPARPFVFTAGRLWDEGKGIATLDGAAEGLPWPVLAAGDERGPNGARIALRHVRPLGRLEPAAVAARLAARPVVCSPALYEPFGLAVLEAAEAGCPLVLSDIATFRELWDGAAIFVPPRDPGALAAALRTVCADPAEQARWGAAARARAARYTQDRMVEGTLAVYRQVLASRHSPTETMAAVSLAS